MKQNQITLFALDCGSTNWRLYRSEYHQVGSSVQMVGTSQPAPLTSFVDRRLPAVICLNAAGNILDSYGDIAQQQLDDERQRERIREHFKPCIGAHLEKNPLPHQKCYTHTQAMEYTQLLLKAVLEQLRQEKWRSASFDDRVVFSFAYPVHWRYDHDERIFDEFTALVRGSFPEGYDGIRFVAEPEGAILALGANGSSGRSQDSDVNLIIDVGGSTTDIVAGRMGIRGGRMEFLGRYGEAFGGGLFDAELAKVIADELNVPASAMADDPSALMSLRVSAQRLKESLSRQLLQAGQLNHVPQRTVTLVMQNSSIYRGVIALDETRFRAITANLEAHFINLVENALAMMNIREEQIGQVVLVGGGAQLFTLIGHLRQRFGSEKVILADNPEEIVVQGLGLEYGTTMDKIEPTIQFPTNTGDKSLVSKNPNSFSSWMLVAEDGRNLPLRLGTITVGRGEENDLCLIDEKASRLHAELRITSDKLDVIDLGSTNGTFLNRERIVSNLPRELEAGDELHFGKKKYICQRNLQ